MRLAREPFRVQMEERERDKKEGERRREERREFSGVLLISGVPTHNHNLLILKAKILKVFTIKD